MSRIVPYNRNAALAYTKRWALDRNPKYFDYEKIGGDCTNFVSQVLLAGSCLMNYKKTFGWYYSDANNKSPSWTNVDFLYDFLKSNKTFGPFCEEVDINGIVPGDIVQLNFEGDYAFDHSLIISEVKGHNSYSDILICSHTYNRLNEPLSNIDFKKARFLHIIGSYA